jgi:cytochrome c-type biogenesis protein CcmH
MTPETGASLGFWIAAAALTALCCTVLIAPLAGRKRLALVVMILVPLSAMGLYLQLGNPDLPDQPLAGRDSTAREMRAGMFAAATELEQRLDEGEADPAAWTLLGQTWLKLEQPTRAADAFGRAAEQAPGEAATTLRLAQLEALAAAGDGRLDERAQAVLATLERQAPAQAGVRYYKGVSLWQAGRMQEAQAIWQKLEAEAAGDESWLPMLRERLKDNNPDG